MSDELKPVAWQWRQVRGHIWRDIDPIGHDLEWYQARPQNYSVRPLYTADALEAAATEAQRLRAEINQAREVCSLVRRQDYFDVPLATLVEAQIVFERWRTAQDMIEHAAAMQPDTNRPLNQWRERALSNQQEGTK
jgi:hypothetical protein